jgi:hypothetical protein
MGCAHGVSGNTPNSAILPYVTACRTNLPLTSLGLVRNPQGGGRAKEQAAREKRLCETNGGDDEEQALKLALSMSLSEHTNKTEQKEEDDILHAIALSSAEYIPSNAGSSNSTSAPSTKRRRKS